MKKNKISHNSSEFSGNFFKNSDKKSDPPLKPSQEFFKNFEKKSDTSSLFNDIHGMESSNRLFDLKPILTSNTQKTSEKQSHNDCYESSFGSKCTLSDIYVAINATNNLDDKYGVGANILNIFRTDIRWDCASEHILRKRQ